MTTNWPTDERLDALMEAAKNTRSRALVFDPESPDGFRAMTPAEDRALIDSIALPHQRHTEDREHLVRARDRAELSGDLDRADEIGENLRTLEDERARDQRADPRLPSRDQVDRLWERGEEVGWSPATSTAVAYLDERRDYTDERRAAHDRGDLGEVDRLDREQDARDRGLREFLDDAERENDDRTELPIGGGSVRSENDRVFGDRKPWRRGAVADDTARYQRYRREREAAEREDDGRER